MIQAAAKWTHAFNQDRVLVQSSLQKMPGWGSGHTLRWFGQPCLERLSSWPFSRYSKLTFFLVWRSPLYSIRSSSSLFNDGRTFWLVMMTPRWWQGHHHPVSGWQRSWEVTCHHSCPFALQAADRGRWPATNPILSLCRRRIVGCGRMSEWCSKTCLLLVNDPDKHIRIGYAGRPDVMFASVMCLSLRKSG